MDHRKTFEQLVPEKYLPVNLIKPLPATASDREYFRIITEVATLMGVVSKNVKENEAFFQFQKTLKKNKINVPDLVSVSDDRTVYILDDLGDNTLFDVLEALKSTEDYQGIIGIYKKVIDLLIQISTIDIELFPWEYAYPQKFFDEQAIKWDLNYFKYCFLKPLRIKFDEPLLEKDFETITSYLLSGNNKNFVHRDFQSKNIMFHKEEIYLIDFQGARIGSRFYDLASLLNDSKAGLLQEHKNELLDYYLGNLPDNLEQKQENKNHFSGWAFIRALQALGAYGFRGVLENKPGFIRSIPNGIRNLNIIYNELKDAIQLPEIEQCIEQLLHHNEFSEYVNNTELTISIHSFSYRKRLPSDISGNGGGFVFDCRHIHNPGRYPEYTELTGKDKKVIDFLDYQSEMPEFLMDVFSIIKRAIINYKEKGYLNLMVSFGCTGGRHRSVYAAEKLFKYVREELNIKARLVHYEQEGLR